MDGVRTNNRWPRPARHVELVGGHHDWVRRPHRCREPYWRNRNGLVAGSSQPPVSGGVKVYHQGVNDQHKGPRKLIRENVTLTSATASGKGIGKVSGAS